VPRFFFGQFFILIYYLNMKKSASSSVEHTSLYRKYRPQNFAEVIGQDHIVKVLKGAIDLGNISHAYLFAGSRGTGKTSIARIIASELGTSASDLYEMDAASNRGIDDIRDIRISVETLPFESKYKVYIIDEVHMLTKDAFNALLKTLEEPPSYVVFILATTEIEKIPDTVLSRCQIFQFKKPNQKLLKDLVLSISKKEGFTIDGSGAELIAMLGDGSFRDAQGILQKVLSFTKDKKISLAEIEMVTGAPKGSIVNDFVVAVSEKNVAIAMASIKEAGENNVDIKVFLKLAIAKMRYVLLLKYAKEMSDNIKENVSEEDFEFLKKISERTENSINSSVLSELLLAEQSVSRAYISELPVELALIKLFGN